MDSFREILFDYRTTARAHLGCIGRIDQNHFATGTRSLVRNVSPESIPACIQYSLSHVWFLFDEIFDIDIFQADYAIIIDYLMAELMREVISEVPKSFIDMTDNLCGLLAFGRSMRELVFLALGNGKFIFTCREISLILYENAIG